MPREPKQKEFKNWLREYEAIFVLTDTGETECVLFRIMDKLTETEKEKRITLAYGRHKILNKTPRVATI